MRRMVTALSILSTLVSGAVSCVPRARETAPIAETAAVQEASVIVEKICRELGCVGALFVRIPGIAPPSFSMTVNGGGTSVTADCPGDSPSEIPYEYECHEHGVTFGYFAPDEFEVTVRWDDMAEVKPEFCEVLARPPRTGGSVGIDGFGVGAG